ncbi:RNA polymerase II transcription factor SIII subunit A-domain-containing protein [Dipodascopsis tothii]|uniref:RNA polymerase II transcription factor SIII subunit A-domain-containing protein n=1 Tax=Dipodascopsis tothii TaxID=44089 RepID=UPI0034CEFC4A
MDISDGAAHNSIPTLFNICNELCLKYASHITDIGNTPYDLVRPILSRLSPEQLRIVERNSPHVRKQSLELWKKHLSKDFPHDVPSSGNPRKAYAILEEQQKSKLADASSKMQRFYAALEKEKSSRSIISLEKDPIGLLNKRKRLMGFGSTPSKKSMSIVKRARYEAKANPLFAKSNPQFASRSRETAGMTSIVTGREPLTQEQAKQKREQMLQSKMGSRSNNRPVSEKYKSLIEAAVPTQNRIQSTTDLVAVSNYTVNSF